ncbi:Focadhesin like protein [Argiope bruennichi]|uniref:Focadhesin like protein n=1 Tax=Argiope bruennichi TaxID=94029 RepID=A0A8T0FMD7_ARGBR|nr:Focadhesin like protein [Argiope bruennichi]
MEDLKQRLKFDDVAVRSRIPELNLLWEVCADESTSTSNFAIRGIIYLVTNCHLDINYAINKFLGSLSSARCIPLLQINFTSSFVNLCLASIAKILKIVSGELIEKYVSIAIVLLDFHHISPTIAALLASSVIHLLPEPSVISFNESTSSSLSQLLTKLEQLFLNSKDSGNNAITSQNAESSNGLTCSAALEKTKSINHIYIEAFTFSVQSSLQCAKFAIQLDEANFEFKQNWLETVKNVVSCCSADNLDMIFSLVTALFLSSTDNRNFIISCLETFESILAKSSYLYAIPPILSILKVMANEDHLKAQAIHLMMQLWKKHDRCFSYLHKLLTETHKIQNKDLNINEALIAQAAAIREICLIAPEKHGVEFLGILSKIFNESNDEANLPAACLALDGVIHLCKSEAKTNLQLPPSMKTTPFEMGKLPEDVLTYIPGYCYLDLLKSLENDIILKVGVLLSYEPPLEIGKDGEPIKRSLASQSRFFEQVLSVLLNEVNIDTTDWHRCILLPSAWGAFMERAFFTCEESRKAELDLQRSLGHREFTPEEFNLQCKCAWLWVRDRLLSVIKTSVKNAPTSHANAIFAISGLIQASNKFQASLDDSTKALSDDNESYTNHQVFATEYTETVICAMISNYKTKGKVHSWLLTHLSRANSSAGSCSLISLTIAVASLSHNSLEESKDWVSTTCNLLHEKLKEEEVSSMSFEVLNPFLIEAALNIALNQAKGSPYATNLLSLYCCPPLYHTLPIIDWLLLLLQSQYLDDSEKYFIKLSLCGLRSSDEFKKSDIWTNVLCSIFH